MEDGGRVGVNEREEAGGIGSFSTEGVMGILG